MKLSRWIGAAIVFMAVFVLALWITPKLPEAALFWLKLASFFISTAFGIIGVVTDFKDDNGRLTRPGKLNLAGLVLAAIVGVVAQKAENDKSRATSEAAQRVAEEESKSLKEINAQNQAVLGRVETLLTGQAKTDQTAKETGEQVLRNLDATRKTNSVTQNALHQVQRGLEPLSVTITYKLKIPSTVSPSDFTYLRRKTEELGASGTYSDEHTDISSSFEPSPERIVYFQKGSALVAHNSFLEEIADLVPFMLGFSKTRMDQQVNCGGSFGIPFRWSRAATIEKERHSLEDGPNFAGTIVLFESRDDFVVQGANAVFEYSDPIGNPLLSALDLSKMYMRVQLSTFTPEIESAFEFQMFDIHIGQHYFVLDSKDFTLDKCRGFTYHLPKIESIERQSWYSESLQN